MAEVIADVGSAEWEKKQLENIDGCFRTIEQLQNLFLGQLSGGDLEKAEGRRCVLRVSGLKHYQYEKYFEGTTAGVKIVPPYLLPNTYIVAPVDSVYRVLNGVLNGDTAAFSSEWARGRARIVGERKLHDGYVFSEKFKKLANIIRKYRGRQ